MASNLDTLSEEILEYLPAKGFIVFHGQSRLDENMPIVMWDYDRHRDYKPFVEAAHQAGVKMMVFHRSIFSELEVEDAITQLSESNLDAEEQRDFEQHLEELRAWTGFTCEIELSFDLDGRTYVFGVQTEWGDTLRDLLDEIESAGPGKQAGEGPMGGYFSKN